MWPKEVQAAKDMFLSFTEYQSTTTTGGTLYQTAVSCPKCPKASPYLLS